MKLWSNPVSLLCISFGIGIFLAKNYSFQEWTFYALSAILLSFIFVYFKSKFTLLSSALFPTISTVCFVGLGFFCFQIHQAPQQSKHYINHIKSKEFNHLVLEINEQKSSNSYYDNYIAEVRKVSSKNTEGKILFSVEKDSLSRKFLLGEIIFLNSKITPVFSSKNPFQFDYRAFLKNRGIHRQLTTSFEKVISIDTSTNLQAYAEKAQQKIHQAITKNSFSKKQTALMEALLLGRKNQLKDGTYEKFTKAGVVHILAISGLHIGIILWILYALFYPLRKILFGKVIASISIILLLWIYAFLVGLTPSVLRAVTMFTCVSIGLFMDRKSSVINMLLLSALILLLVNPNLLFKVGFQLSYAAVASIIAFQPSFFKPFKNSPKLIRFFGSIISVTFAAQLGVLPLSIFYFHQFPGLFFLTNIIVVPALGIILSIGVLVIFLALINQLPAFIKSIYQFILDTLMQVINWVAMQENFLIEKIYFPVMFCFCSYVVIIAFYNFLANRTQKNTMLFLSCIIGFQVFYIINFNNKKNHHSFTVFHQYKASIIGIQENTRYSVFTDSLGKSKANKLVKPIAEEFPIDTIMYKNQFKNWYQIDDLSVFVIDENTIYKLPKHTEVDILLLTNSSKINLNRVINRLTPQKIIVDGSNYKNYVKRWRETCKQKKVPFHYTGKKGAFTIDY
ncbi:ComEC/Rec2 family competence protein [Mesonia aquimarina]|uniref:ComEC/Rec2 family competence protein n=1 Tax=Mesonia aquimarina TaxID=1504967 RepID=UPI000EF5928D|nr:ComEC/Rec2 family competence protein [Mesonia aquimarina]